MTEQRIERLTKKRIEHVKEPGEYGDGYNSYGLKLRVKKVSSGLSKTFIQRIVWRGMNTNLGLGSFPDVSLREARDIARENWDLLQNGIHPRRQHKITVPTFADAAEAYIEAKIAPMKHGETKSAEWRSLIAREANPVLGRLLVAEIKPVDIEDALRSIWIDRHKTAKRLRNMLSKIMVWSKARGYRSDNPASYEIIRELMPTVLSRTDHRAAMAHESVGPAILAMMELDAHPATQLCVLFIILTACRSQEARLATWDEIDRDSSTWTKPPEHTKKRREHRVPLSRGALMVLEIAEALNPGSPLIFPSPADPAMPLTAAGLLVLLKRVDPDVTIHGFRSTFRTWGTDNKVPNEVGRAALSHRKEDPMDEIYDRSELLDDRRLVMPRWDSYVESQIPGGWEAALDALHLRVRAADISLRIRERRQEWGISIMRLAQIAGVSHDVLGLVEKEGHIPRSQDALRALEEWLEQDVPGPDPLLQDLGERVREARNMWFMSQEQLAERLGLASATVSLLERGRQPIPETLELVMDWLADPIPERLRRLWEQREVLKEHLGPRILTKRQEWNMTRTQLAPHLGVHEATLKNWEQQKFPVPDRHLPVVFDWLEASITDRPKYVQTPDPEEVRVVVEQMARERRRLGISQGKLAKIIGVNPSLIWNWEQDRYLPGPENLTKVVEWLPQVQEDEEIPPAA